MTVATAVAALTAALALAGCGAGSGPLTAAQVIAFATRVNVNTNDVPGAVSAAVSGESRYEPALAAEAETLRCAGLQPPAPAHGQASGTYRVATPSVSVAGGGFVISTVIAVPGPSARARSAARARLASLASPRWPACARRYDSLSFFSVHPHAAYESGAVPLSAPAGVITRRTRFSYARPETIYLPGPGGGEVRAVHRIGHITRYADVLAFVAGRGLVEVETTSLTTPPSIATDRRVLEVVRSRAGSAGL